MWVKMKASGWTHIAGSGLVLWYSMHPTCAGLKKKELLRDKKEGIDYFTSQEDLKQYAKLYLGWLGDGVGADSPNDTELVERVKKRKRRATLKAAEQATAKSMLQMKKNASKSATARQQTCNRMTKGSAPKMAACSEVCSGSVHSVEILFVKRADEKGSMPPRRREM